MTQPTGSQSQASPSNPWEQKWNDTKEVIVDTPKPAVAASNPWDKEWASNAPPDAPRNVPSAPAVASKPNIKAAPIAASGDWTEINKKYAQGSGQRFQDQMTILEAELAKEKDPKNIAALKQEMANVVKANKVTSDKKVGDSGQPNQRPSVSEEYVNNMLAAAKKNPEFKEMQDFLGEDFPKVNTRYLGDTVSGQFSTNVDSSGPLDKRGEIDIGYGGFNYKDKSANDSGMNTLVHETAHATDRKIRLLANSLEGKKDLTPTQKQFLDSYSKLNKFDWSLGELNDNRMGGQSGIANAIKSLAPSWFGKEKDYRASSRELVGFGVGNASVPKGSGSDKNPQHVDPTVATMFMIILDQAKRVQKELKK